MGYRPDSFRLSARSLAMFGFTSDDEKIGATHAAWQARIHPEDLPVILAKVRAYQKPVGAIGVRVPRSSSIRRFDLGFGSRPMAG